jgi:DNA-binding transcriptional regulator YiaG
MFRMSITVTPKQVRQAREHTKLSAEKAGELVYVSGRMWRKYESGEAPINLAVWELFLIKTNQVLVNHG